MKASISITCLTFLFLCKTNENNNVASIGSRVISDEIGGSAYRNKATEYFIINNGDTSNFQPIFSERKKRKTVDIDYNMPHRISNLTFKEKLSQLKHILPEAMKEYNLDSLRGLHIGTFIQTGDYALRATESYTNKYSKKKGIPTKHYTDVCKLLLNTALSTDLNEMLSPYSIEVKKGSIEKAHFTSKDYFLKYAKSNRDTSDVPNDIIDGMLWIKLGRIK